MMQALIYLCVRINECLFVHQSVYAMQIGIYKRAVCVYLMIALVCVVNDVD